MTKSTFFHDGYRDASIGAPASPPDVKVYEAEYLEGYREARATIRTINSFTAPHSEGG